MERNGSNPSVTPVHCPDSRIRYPEISERFDTTRPIPVTSPNPDDDDSYLIERPFNYAVSCYYKDKSYRATAPLEEGVTQSGPS